LPKKDEVTLIDVGTGAGFPAIPLAIACPHVRVTLLDSLNKRLLFLQEVCRELGIDAQTVHARAEDGGNLPALREQFDVAVARAVAALPVLAEYCLPFCKVGGSFLAMKGPESDAEYSAAKTAVTVLGGKEKMAHSFLLPATAEANIEQQERRIFVFEKIKPTPVKYPRPTAKIKKEPLR
jgi:16S rRNA (guanine527-N7)-methyltransferase